MVRRILGCALIAVQAFVLAAGLIGTGVPASASAVPGPRSEEWWFIAWDIQNKVWHLTRGRGMTIAVIDTGVNASLPELRGVVLPGADGRHGYHTDGRRDINPFDGRARKDGHGTGMAGLIAAQGGPSGMVGIAPEAKILPIVVDSFPSTISEDIVTAANRGAQVINISQGPTYPGGCPGDVQAAVSYAIRKGAVVVASMGNSGNTINDIEFPGSCAGVLAVGAVTDQKLAWTDTQRHSYVSVAAPGVGVGLLTRHGTFNPNYSGTSQASALTSGAVALVRSRFPRLSPRQVVQRIINTTVDAGPPGHDNMTGSGVVVPIRALTMSVPGNAPNPTFARLDQWRRENPSMATMFDSPSPSPASGSSAPEQGHASGGTDVGAVAVGAIGLVVLAAGAVVVNVFVRRRTPRRAAGQRPGISPLPPDSLRR